MWRVADNEENADVGNVTFCHRLESIVGKDLISKKWPERNFLHDQRFSCSDHAKQSSTVVAFGALPVAFRALLLNLEFWCNYTSYLLCRQGDSIPIAIGWLIGLAATAFVCFTQQAASSRAVACSSALIGINPGIRRHEADVPEHRAASHSTLRLNKEHTWS